MFRTKTLIIMTALMVSFLIPTVVFAESDTVTFGTAVVTNDQAVNDSLVVSMSGVTPLPKVMHIMQCLCHQMVLNL